MGRIRAGVYCPPHPSIRLVDGAAQYLLRDDQVSVGLIVDASGASVAERLYAPYGEETDSWTPQPAEPLAGGSGTRLLPLSRKSYPKQFSALMGEETLFQGPVRRLSGSGDGIAFAAPLVLTNTDFRFIVTE